MINFFNKIFKNKFKNNKEIEKEIEKEIAEEHIPLHTNCRCDKPVIVNVDELKEKIHKIAKYSANQPDSKFDCSVYHLATYYFPVDYILNMDKNNAEFHSFYKKIDLSVKRKDSVEYIKNIAKKINKNNDTTVEEVLTKFIKDDFSLINSVIKKSNNPEEVIANAIEIVEKYDEYIEIDTDTRRPTEIGMEFINICLYEFLRR